MGDKRDVSLDVILTTAAHRQHRLMDELEERSKESLRRSHRARKVSLGGLFIALCAWAVAMIGAFGWHIGLGVVVVVVLLALCWAAWEWTK